MRNHGVELERFADCITLLKRGPVSAGEIAQRLGVLPESARRWCRTLEDKGHARSQARVMPNGRPAVTWEWQ